MATPNHLGKYEVTEVLGRGAMGVVYKGFDPGIRRTVAIKTIRRVARAGAAECRSASAARQGARRSGGGEAQRAGRGGGRGRGEAAARAGACGGSEVRQGARRNADEAPCADRSDPAQGERPTRRGEQEPGAVAEACSTGAGKSADRPDASALVVV